MVKSDVPPRVKINIEWKPSVKYNEQKVQLSADKIHGDVVVNWGRDSLYKAPRTRTASFTIIDHTYGIQPGDWLYQKVEIIVGSQAVFHGRIDHVKVRHYTRAGGKHSLLLDIDAVEGSLFEKVLYQQKDVWVTDRLSPVTAWQNEMRAAGMRADLSQLRDSKAEYAKFYEPVKMTMKDALEMAFNSPSLMGHAQWMPNHSTIGSTIGRIWKTEPNTVYIPATNVEVQDAEATLEKTPKAWGTTTGGAFGNETPWVYWDRLGDYAGSPRAQIKSPIQWNHSAKGSDSELWDNLALAAYVRTDPQRVSIYDSTDKVLTTAHHLITWEMPTYGVKFTGQLDGPRFINPDTGQFDRLRSQNLHTDDWWYPIGGQLRVSQHQVVHHWNAIKLVLDATAKAVVF